jgi:hypothetical protein
MWIFDDNENKEIGKIVREKSFLIWNQSNDGINCTERKKEKIIMKVKIMRKKLNVEFSKLRTPIIFFQCCFCFLK